MPKREDLQSHRILYYQWVPYIFLFQAFLFYAPSLIWSVLSSTTGFDIDNYVRELKKDDKSEAAKYVATHIRECTDFRTNYESRGFFKKTFKNTFAKGNVGIFLTLSYIFVKFIYAGVALLQIFILNYWFRDDFNSKETKMSFFYGAHNWKLSERFPKMTLCKFEVYILNDQQTHVN